MKRIAYVSLAITAVIILLAGKVWAPPPGGSPPGNMVARIVALEDAVATLANRVIALEATLDCVSYNASTKNFLFDGCNVQIVNGEDRTDTINGLGNLIVGYNATGNAPFACSDGQYKTQEDCELAGETWDRNHRSGSHNIVGGEHSSYSSYGGAVFGVQNVINRRYSSVTGGSNNVASGPVSSVSGGSANRALAGTSSVSGGQSNTASGGSSSVSGGRNNIADGMNSSVSGGWRNEAQQYDDWVGGGEYNIASGTGSSVIGGSYNNASGIRSSVSGGKGCTELNNEGWSVGAVGGGCFTGN